MNLVFLNSIKGLFEQKIVSHTEKVYYFIVNYTKEHLEASLEKEFSELQEGFYSGSTKFATKEDFERYTHDQLEILDRSIDYLNKHTKLEMISTTNFEKDLMSKIDWAKMRLKPYFPHSAPTPAIPVTTQQQQQTVS